MPDKVCPECGAHLEAHLVDRIEADVCGSCGGVWFGPGMFGKVMLGHEVADIEKLDEAPTSPDAPHRAPSVCISCGQSLMPFHYADGSILIYRCEACGGVFVPFEAMMPLLRRQHQLSDMAPVEVSHASGADAKESVAACVAELEGMEIRDGIRARAWIGAMNGLMSPMM